MPPRSRSAAAAAAFGDEHSLLVERLVVHEPEAILPDQIWRIQTTVLPSGRARRPRSPSTAGRRHVDSQWQELATATVSMVATERRAQHDRAEDVWHRWRRSISTASASSGSERGLELGAALALRPPAVDGRTRRSVGPDRVTVRLTPVRHLSAAARRVRAPGRWPGATHGIKRIGAVTLTATTSPSWCRIQRSGAGVDVRFYDAAGDEVASCTLDRAGDAAVRGAAAPSRLVPRRGLGAVVHPRR